MAQNQVDLEILQKLASFPADQQAAILRELSPGAHVVPLSGSQFGISDPATSSLFIPQQEKEAFMFNKPRRSKAIIADNLTEDPFKKAQKEFRSRAKVIKRDQRKR